MSDLRAPLAQFRCVKAIPGSRVPLWREAIAGPPAPGVTWGVRTGEGGWVLDLDRKNGTDGVKAIEDVGRLPLTFTVRTQSGGRHAYFLPPADGRTVITRSDVLGGKTGVDVRGRGGFAIGPGTPGYVVECPAPLAHAPEWLLDLVCRPAGGDHEIPASSIPVIAPGNPRYPAAIQAAIAICDRWPLAGVGERDGRLFALACALVEDANLPDGELLAFLGSYNARLPVPHEAPQLERKIASARATCGSLRGPVEPLTERIIPLPTGPLEIPAGEAAPPSPEFTKSGELKLRVALPHEIAGALSRDPRWQGGRWVFDEVHGEPAFDGTPPIPLDCRFAVDGAHKSWGPSDRDIFALRSWLGASYGYRAAPSDVRAALWDISQGVKVNPIHRRLQAIREKGLPPLDLRAWATETLGLESEIEAEAVEKWLIAAVRRGERPGTKVDQVLILHGTQGFRKSSFVQALFGEQWVKDSPIKDFTNRDSLMVLRGFWCVEFAELQSLLRQDYNAAKLYLTLSHDDFRQMGSASLTRQLRACVFIGTTNEKDILQDPTGSRRFHPVFVTKPIDSAKVARDAERVWASACALADQGVPHYWEAEPEAYSDVKAALEAWDPWAAYVADWLLVCGKAHVSTTEILEKAIYALVPSVRERVDAKTTGRVKRILQRLGMTEARPGKRDRRRLWDVNAAALNACARISEAHPIDGGPGAPSPSGKVIYLNTQKTPSFEGLQGINDLLHEVLGENQTSINSPNPPSDR